MLQHIVAWTSDVVRLLRRHASVLVRSDTRDDEDMTTARGISGAMQAIHGPVGTADGIGTGASLERGRKTGSVFDRRFDGAVELLVGEVLPEVGGDPCLRRRAIADGSRTRLHGINLRAEETRAAETEAYNSSTHEDQ